MADTTFPLLMLLILLQVILLRELCTLSSPELPNRKEGKERREGTECPVSRKDEVP